MRDDNPGSQPCQGRYLNQLVRSLIINEANSGLSRTYRKGRKGHSQRRCPSLSGAPQKLHLMSTCATPTHTHRATPTYKHSRPGVAQAVSYFDTLSQTTPTSSKSAGSSQDLESPFSTQTPDNEEPHTCIRPSDSGAIPRWHHQLRHQPWDLDQNLNLHLDVQPHENERPVAIRALFLFFREIVLWFSLQLLLGG